MQNFYIDRMASPLGELLLIADAQGQLRGLDWGDHEARLMALMHSHYRTAPFQLQEKSNPGGLTETLTRYFSGDLAAINDVAVCTAGTEFQHSVWRQLRQIPCGEVISYGELARRIGRPTASRAVGMANGANPISIVVPCHRVIGAQGALTGYAGGVHRKAWLLRHEGFLPAQG